MKKTMKDICPDWDVPASAAARRKELREYAISEGFKPEEISRFNKDGRIVTSMMKARLYDQMARETPGKQPYEKSHGGNINGPGTSTSDSIPARLSDGEYVLNAESVKTINQLLGPDFLNKLNKLRK